MTLITVDSLLSRMVERTPTDCWNDSCAVAELAYAGERGGTGATSDGGAARRFKLEAEVPMARST
jgi:hypothetical protein